MAKVCLFVKYPNIILRFSCMMKHQIITDIGTNKALAPCMFLHIFYAEFNLATSCCPWN